MGPLAVPEKIIGASPLHFFDRCAINNFTSSATGGVKLLLGVPKAFSFGNQMGPLAVPEKIIGASPLHFFDRCAINNFTSSATGGVKLFIPIRRIKSISKLFCLENIIRGGFV